MRARGRGPQAVPALSPEKLLAANNPNPAMMQDPRILLQQARQVIERQAQDLARLSTECDGMKMRMKHFTGILVSAIRTHFEGKEFRIPVATFEKVEDDIGVNTRKDTVSDELVVEILSIKEFQNRMRGLEMGHVDVTVPKKSPFKVSIKLKEGARFEGAELVQYLGGKSNGVELQYVQGKPKKVREYTCDKDANFTFTVDSAGMNVRIQFLSRIPVADPDPEPEPESDKPLEYKNEECREWHETENDGSKIVGRFCPHCGDSRKVLPEPASV